MQIRAATEEDLPEVSAIYDHHAISSVSTFDDESPGPERWLSKVGDDRVDGEHLLVVVADDGEVRGYAESSVFRPDRRTPTPARSRSTSASTRGSRATAASCTTSCSGCSAPTASTWRSP